MKYTKSGLNFFPEKEGETFEKLPNNVFILKKSINSFYFEKSCDNFSLPEKLFGDCNDFSERVVNLFRNSNKNEAILFSGLKGSGKTITAKLICNKLNLPVIIISEQEEGLEEFLVQIDQEVIIFIDEFEKVYSSSDEYIIKFLSLLDGAYSKKEKMLFLLTTNDLSINYNLLNRPGRIRYIKKYQSLTREEVEEILDYLLKDKSMFEDCIKYIQSLKVISFDIVSKIIEEINVFNQLPEKFKDFFNAEEKIDTYSVSKKEGNEFRLIGNRMKVFPPLTSEYIDYSLKLDGNHVGIIKHIHENIVVILSDDVKETYSIVPNETNNLFSGGLEY